MVLEGIGQWKLDNPLYLAKASAMGGPLPQHELLYMNIAINESPEEKPAKPVDFILNTLNEMDAGGRMPEIGIQFYDFSPPSDSPYSATSHDDLVAAGTNPDHESQIRRIGAALAQFDKPVFVKIGFEFNNKDAPSPPAPEKGKQSYHPYDFPVAYAKTRQYIIDEYTKLGKTPKVAWIWTWEAAAPTDYLDVDPVLGPKWYPGDDQVDWFGIDYFGTNDFTSQAGPAPFGPSHLNQILAFLASADSKGKPVYLAETSEVNIDIPVGATDTANVWDTWFVPWLAFLNAHPQIKSFSYIDHDWHGGGGPPTWQDGRRYNNDEIMEKWLAEMKKPQYLHAGNFSMLLGYSAV